MEKDIVDIIKNKDFIELNNLEREELKDYCSSEDEYNQMREVFLVMESMKDAAIEPSRETKESLDQLFYKAHPASSPMWYSGLLSVVLPREKPLHRQPLLQVAALLLILFIVVPFGQKLNHSESNKVAELNKVDDTKTKKKESTVLNQELNEITLSSEEMKLSESHNFTKQNAGLTIKEKLDSGERAMNDLSVDQLSAETSVGIHISEHPDGIFKGSIDTDLYSFSAADEPDILDLLTAAF